MITLYKVLTYLLLPVGAMLGIMGLLGLLMGLANPVALLPVFLVIATVLYIFSSFRFLTLVVDGRNQASSRLKDWVRVNALVAIVFAMSTLLQSISLSNNPALLNDVLEQTANMRQMPMQLPKETMMKAMKGTLYIMLTISVVLLVHIMMSLRLLQQYKEAFTKE